MHKGYKETNTIIYIQSTNFLYPPLGPSQSNDIMTEFFVELLKCICKSMHVKNYVIM
jgi:hypothetical protein